ncbi:restriction endonuclease subunit S [Cyclobacterium marinum]|uniref:restriction endonuclease subunit S n=1 Tax=Cyclobacterium marinum TaxID=104 RepID=UPI0011EE0E84|nr:restriction endonuclease subunit S [Cyclobacterium marinum]MBI0397471.1 restriction endonuclease subunit S [Cyclobacterium marinum]
MREGWEIKKLKEVCHKITDGTHQTPKYFNEGVIFLSSKNVTKGKIDWENIKYIDEAQHIEMHKRVAPKVGDILLAKNGTTGVAAMVDKNVVFDIYVSLAHIRSLGEVSPEYMLYFINSPLAKKQFNSRLKGVGVPNLHLKEIREVEIPFPKSLIEQKQIVALLDQAFAAIDQAKANIEKNIANAKELFQSKLNEIFSQKGEGWEEKTLGDVCEIKPPKKLAKEKLNDSDLVSFVPMKYLNANKMYFNSEETRTLKKLYSSYVYFEDGDVILAKITPCFENGKLGIAKNLENGIGFGSSEYVVYRVNKNKLSPEFLYFFLNRESFRIKGKSLMSGAVGHKRIQPNFYEGEIISLPSLQNQKNILTKITTVQINLNQIESKYRQKLHDLEELKKSILQKAFAGELTMSELMIESD